MNNNSIINRILFAVTIFQHSPLTRRVFYNIIKREREGSNINNIWNTDWHIYKSSKVLSSSISASTSRSWNGIIIICINMDQYNINTSSSSSITTQVDTTSTSQHEGWSIININTRMEIFNMKLASQQHQQEVGNHQHEAGISTTSTQRWKSSTRSWKYSA